MHIYYVKFEITGSMEDLVVMKDFNDVGVGLKSNEEEFNVIVSRTSHYKMVIITLHVLYVLRGVDDNGCNILILRDQP